MFHLSKNPSAEQVVNAESISSKTKGRPNTTGRPMRILSLDVIRILAMALIIIFHWNVSCQQQQITAKPILFLTFANGNIANIGVSLFFILSGASLYYTTRDKLRLRTYYRKRFLSIYPLYWITYLVIFLYFYQVKNAPMLYKRRTLLLSFLGMDGYLSEQVQCYYLIGEWFVGCIVLLYLIYPLLHLGVRKHPLLTAVLTLCWYIPMIQFYPFTMSSTHFFLTRVPEMMIGMYYIKYFYAPDKIKEQSFGMPILPGIAALLLFLFLLYVPVPLSESYLNILLGTSCFLALSALLRYLERSDKKQRIQKPIIRFSGYTYGIFLIHHILIGEFTLPHAETTMSLPQMWILFFCYLVYISVCGAVLTRFSGWCIRTIRNYLSCRKNRGNYNSTIR